MNFKSPFSNSRTSLEAYSNLNFHLSKSRTSLQTYLDFIFHVSLSRPSLQAALEHESSKSTNTDAPFEWLRLEEYDLGYAN